MIEMHSFKKQWQETSIDVLTAFQRVAESGWYILGKEVESFERELQPYIEQKHVIGVASGLDAIEICLRALGCGSGDRVLTSPVSAFATTLAIMKIGAIPVFVDVDRNGLIDLDLAESVLESNPGIKYFLPVHLYGHCLDLDKMTKLRDRFALKIVEDCAQSIGARYNGKVSGTIGQMAAFSFYPTKNLGALGDGGAVGTHDSHLAEVARSIRDYGQSAKYQHTLFGLNSRLDEVHAGILKTSFLPRLDRWSQRRKEIAKQYHELKSLTHVEMLMPHANSDSVWHLFPLKIHPKKRDGFQKFLMSKGIQTAIHYPLTIPEQKALIDYGRFFCASSLPNAKALCTSEVSIPIHPFLSDDDIEMIKNTILDWDRVECSL